jgi:hypothetical protein
MLERPAVAGLFLSNMSDKPLKLPLRPQSSRREIADYINHALRRPTSLPFVKPSAMRLGCTTFPILLKKLE